MCGLFYAYETLEDTRVCNDMYVMYYDARISWMIEICKRTDARCAANSKWHFFALQTVNSYAVKNPSGAMDFRYQI